MGDGMEETAMRGGEAGQGRAVVAKEEKGPRPVRGESGGLTCLVRRIASTSCVRSWRGSPR